ncbi:MAG: hypothetical protein K2G84_01395 [Muribaculaceae bacterium]|nr:hypothetical protein [Muribaculaceae bacterium]
MNDNESTRARLILETAHSAWERMAPLRSRRSRYCRFTYGDQWGDLTRDRLNRPLTEEEDPLRSGCKPLTNNLIRRMVKAVVGRFRMERAENPASTREADPDGLNHLDELDARTLEEFLISGMAIHRVRRERRPSGQGVWADNIPPDRFFVNAFSDSRGCDIELAGSLHDMSLAEVLMRFAGGSPSRAAAIKKLYGAVSQVSGLVTPSSPRDESFFHAKDGRCRVIEVWTLESRERLRCHDPLTATFCHLPLQASGSLRKLNAARRKARLPLVDSRWEVASVWRGRFLSPDGSILDSFDSPLADGSLPYAIKMYPLVGGEVHSLVEDVIGQQKYVNRLITLMDHIMGVSAKGALLFPVECKPGKEPWEKYTNLWATPGSVIPYHPYDGAEPHQVSSPAADIGAREMLQTQIQLFEDISGVSSALMGKSVSGAVGAQRYESEMRNSAISILDLMKTFADFTAHRDRLMSMA